MSQPSLSAVLPIKLSNQPMEGDLERAEMLFKTLQSFAAEERVFQKVVIVAAGNELGRIQKVLGGYSCFDFDYVDEDHLVPEFRKHPSVGGWTRQQVIKLAANRVVETPYYLTLDCDVLCTKRLSLEGLLPGGRALLQLGSKDIRPTWWTSSAQILRVDPKLDEPGMQVTPAILSTEICQLLLQELDVLGSPANAFEYLMKPLERFAFQRLQPGYKKKFRWTEYTLYHLFAESRGLVGKFHTICGTREHPQLLIGDHSVWMADDFEVWEPEKAFSPTDAGLFCVVQSNTALKPSSVWRRVAAHVPAGPNSGFSSLR
jgi:hypothetical protein